MKQIQHFILSADLGQKRITVLDKDLLRQLSTVLRMRAGEQVVLMDGQGVKVLAKLEELHKTGALFLIEKRSVVEAPKRRLRLYSALSKKPATFELIVQKATELGVTDIVPLVTERCQIRELRKTDRLEMIIKEACEQSENAYLPRLHEALRLEDLLRDLPSGMLLAGDPWVYDCKLHEMDLGTGNLNIMIGPEGGLSVNELEAIRAAGGVLFQLGERVLRMETAVIATLSVIWFAK